MLVPPWWGARESRPVVRLQVREAAPNGAPPAGAGAGLLGADALVDFDWQVAAGGAILDKAEFERLVALKTPLVSVKGRWVEFRPGEVEAALRFWTAQAASGPKRLSQVARLALGGERRGGAGGPAAGPGRARGGVARGGRRAGGAARSRRRARPAAAARAGGTLRPYQLRGYAWLAHLRRLGLGACLADDMGLGKTIQMIALLLHEPRPRRAGPRCSSAPPRWSATGSARLARFAPGAARAGPPRRPRAPRARRSRRPPARTT